MGSSSEEVSTGVTEGCGESVEDGVALGFEVCVGAGEVLGGASLAGGVLAAPSGGVDVQPVSKAKAASEVRQSESPCLRVVVRFMIFVLSARVLGGQNTIFTQYALAGVLFQALIQNESITPRRIQLLRCIRKTPVCPMKFPSDTLGFHLRLKGATLSQATRQVLP